MTTLVGKTDFHPFTNNTYSIVGKMTTTFLLVFYIDFVGKMHASQIETQFRLELNFACNIYMFICTELIEETGRPPGLIFSMWGDFCPGLDKFLSFFHTFDEVMT